MAMNEIYSMFEQAISPEAGTFTDSYVVDIYGKRCSIEREGNALCIRGSLELNGCTHVTSLPDDLIISGCLFLNGCTGLTALPAGLTVDGGIDLDNCSNLTCLPDDLLCGSYLYVANCTNLTEFPQFLRIGGNLAIDGSTCPEKLSEELFVVGDMIISSSKLKQLPERLTVKGDLNLTGCLSLSVPADLAEKVRGSITLPNGKVLPKPIPMQPDQPDEPTYRSLSERLITKIRGRKLKGKRNPMDR